MLAVQATNPFWLPAHNSPKYEARCSTRISTMRAFPWKTQLKGSVWPLEQGLLCFWIHPVWGEQLGLKVGAQATLQSATSHLHSHPSSASARSGWDQPDTNVMAHWALRDHVGCVFFPFRTVRNHFPSTCPPGETCWGCLQLPTLSKLAFCGAGGATVLNSQFLEMSEATQRGTVQGSVLSYHNLEANRGGALQQHDSALPWSWG